MDGTDFRFRDYELKTRYLSDHFQRMWTRFNFFLTLESALVGGKFVFGTGPVTPALALLGAMLALVWYVCGAEDRYLVRGYRQAAEDAGRKAASVLLDSTAAGMYAPVGDIHATAGTLDPPKTRLDWLSGWRAEAISTTRLAALFPLAVLLAWLTVFARLQLAR